MRSLVLVVAAFVAIAFAPPALATEPGTGAAPAAQASPDAKCEHGVTQRLCARCNPKLAAVYKAKGDWCAEHERPESQCVICHPELAKQGVK